MKHRIAVPDGLLNPDSPVEKYLTGVAEADTFVHAFAIGRLMAQKYGYAFLLTEDCHHIMAGWRKADEGEDQGGIRPVITGHFIDGHTKPSMHDKTPVEGAPAGGCPECIAVEMSISPYNK